MKNLKIIIIFIILLIGVIVLLVYKTKTNNGFEEFYAENEVYSEELIDELEEGYLVLHITGEINNPGIVKVKSGSRIADVIDAAGGLTQNADTNKINLAYVVSDGQKLYIPSIFDETEKQLISEEIGENVLEVNTDKTKNKININTATQTELEELKGIGPSTALKIIKYRKENGNFKNIEEIKNVPGIGDAKFEAIKDIICI